jgi:hypothetical protein
MNEERPFRITLQLTKEVSDALRSYSKEQIRDPKDQAYILLRQVLIDVGALKLPEHKTGRD